MYKFILGCVCLSVDIMRIYGTLTVVDKNSVTNGG